MTVCLVAYAEIAVSSPPPTENSTIPCMLLAKRSITSCMEAQFRNLEPPIRPHAENLEYHAYARFC
jgi:hypothetical protein